MALYFGSNKKRVTLGSSSVLFATWEVVTGIAITTPPIKTEYSDGEVFDPTGMVVAATYSNGTTKEITNYTIINGDQLSSDMTTIMISYTENGKTVTTTQEISVALPLVYTEIFNFGTITTAAGSGGNSYPIINPGLGTLSRCTHIMVNGELFTVSYSQGEDQNGYACEFLNIDGSNTLDEAHPYQIKLLNAGAAFVLQFISYTAGTFTASIGTMSSGPSASMVTITITGSGYESEGEDDDVFAWIDCAAYGISHVYYPTTYNVEPGTVITLRARQEKSSSDGCIVVNGTTVASGSKDMTYEYTVNSHTTIALKAKAEIKGMYEYTCWGSVTVSAANGADEPTLISFSINESGNTTTYQAEEGMTWGEWVDSEYNDDGRSGGVKPYIVENDMIYHTEQSLSVMVSNVYTFPSPNDLIITNGVYELAKD